MTEKWLNILLKNTAKAKESCVESCVKKKFIRLFRMNDKKRNLIIRPDPTRPRRCRKQNQKIYYHNL